jgi:ABC-type uncharacterized transport system ATPase subunit
MLIIEHLSKTLDTIKAVDDITLEVQKREIFGLLGPNRKPKNSATISPSWIMARS